MSAPITATPESTPSSVSGSAALASFPWPVRGRCSHLAPPSQTPAQRARDHKAIVDTVGTISRVGLDVELWRDTHWSLPHLRHALRQRYNGQQRAAKEQRPGGLYVRDPAGDGQARPRAWQHVGRRVTPHDTHILAR